MRAYESSCSQNIDQAAPSERSDPEPIIDQRRWLRAATLKERVAAGRGNPPEERSGPDDSDGSGGPGLVDAWSRQRPFDEHPELWRRRLERAGLSPEAFERLAARSLDSLAELGRSWSWLRDLASAYEPADRTPVPAPNTPRSDERQEAGFLYLVEPLVEWGRRRLEARVAQRFGPGRDEHAGERLAPAERPPFDPGTVAAMFVPPLRGRLLNRISRPLTVELHAARLEGRLQGETPEDRFASFAEQLRRPAVALEILSTYPVLARSTVETIEDWVDTNVELLDRLHRDRAALEEEIADVADIADGVALGTLTRIELGLGDVHRGGRTVARLAFDSGTELIYKPRSMAAERCFQELVAWFDRRSDGPALRTLRVLDRGDYGWVERVRAAPCPSTEALRRFYHRQGKLLALFYLVGANDMHQENLIAAGEHPVPVDLETLFHPRIDGSSVHHQDRQPLAAIHDSVLRVGMLPHRIWGGAGEGADLSSLGASRERRASREVLATEGAGTDGMRWTPQRVELVGADNLPAPDGATALEDFADDLVAGFTEVYRTALAYRDELAGDRGPLAAFADAEVRVVLRPTRDYGSLLAESFHPHALFDGLERDCLLDRLWAGVPERPFLEAIVASEQRQLRRGDVPVFTMRAGQRDLLSGDGERFAGFFDESGLDQARKRLRRLGPEDLERQTWIVRRCLDMVALEARRFGPDDAAGDDAQAVPLMASAAPTGTSLRGRLLEAATAVGRRLERLAFRSERDVSWLTPRPGANGTWTLEPTGLDLYNGLPGIALFLAHLARVTGDERIAGLADATVTSLLDRLDHPRGGRDTLTTVGAFSGWGGFLYSLGALGTTLERPELIDTAVTEALGLEPAIRQDEASDLVAGAAGCLLCLLRLHRLRPDDRLLALAEACGERLHERAVDAGTGTGTLTGKGWVLELAGETPLAGLSHGAAGIAWALLELAEATGSPRHRKLADAALSYERDLFDPQEANWPDLRASAAMPADLGSVDDPQRGGAHFMSAWCHGAAGIGLGRLAMLELMSGERDADARERLATEIATAIETTFRIGFGPDAGHSLCHGTLGNLELPRLWALRTGDPDLARRVEGHVTTTLDQATTTGWKLGLARAEPPGLMLGLAGIGLGLLRLADPETVPSPLILEIEPPRRCDAGTSCVPDSRPAGVPRIESRRSHHVPKGEHS